jgi:hypothetical protein
MMTNRRRLTLILAWAALAGGHAGPALAADTQTVSATLTVEAACLTISTTAVDFGTLAFSSDGENPIVGSKPISYTNCGGASERIFGRGTDASGDAGAATWTLNTSHGLCPERGLNTYRLGVSKQTYPYFSAELSSIDTQLETVAGGSAGTIDTLYANTPCTGSDGSGVTMSFQVLFTATF